MAKPITINIQWKGTVACLDFVCPKCEAAWHVDTDCDTEIECTACGYVTELPNSLPLPEMKATADEVKAAADAQALADGMDGIMGWQGGTSRSNRA